VQDSVFGLLVGDILVGKFSCLKNARDPRSLIIQLTFGGATHKYLLN